jgi:hypothetical protein
VAFQDRAPGHEGEMIVALDHRDLAAHQHEGVSPGNWTIECEKIGI